MTGLFGNVPFSGFGRSRFWVAGRAPVTERAAASSGQLLRRVVRSRCPRQPGVYGMVDQQGTLIYVGKAKCLRTRLASYFRTKSRDPKAGRIVQATRGLIWECLPSEFAALLRELELIHRWRPRFNVQGQPTRYRRTYVCLGRQPAPYVYLARRPARDVLASLGPVPAGRRAREAVRRLNDWYQLRDCSRAQVMHFADHGSFFLSFGRLVVCAMKSAPVWGRAVAAARVRAIRCNCRRCMRFSQGPIRPRSTPYTVKC